MNLDLLVDPLFRLPFVTGLLLAVALPAVGMYLRLRNEWVAALALAQMASAGALLAMGLGLPVVAGGMVAALGAALVKAFAARIGESGYAMIMLLGWAGAILLVANWPIAEQLGHALFDGQLYFTGAGNLWLAAATVAITAAVLAALSRRLLLARFFPDYFRARGHHERRYHVAFDLLAATVIAFGTTTIGVMAVFALIFVPAWLAYRWGRNWHTGMGIAVGFGALCHTIAFALALGLDQPYGPSCALVLIALGMFGAAVRSAISALHRTRSKRAESSLTNKEGAAP